MLIRESAIDAKTGFKTYTFEGDIQYRVPARYEPKRVIGAGAYGMVCSAVDSSSGEYVAIKKISNLLESKSTCTRILREVQVLTFSTHPNITQLHDLFHACGTTCADFSSEMYVVTHLMDTNASRLLRETYLTSTHVQYISIQLLDALRYLHQHQIIHRDVKPANVLLNEDCLVHLCDFGLARGLGHSYVDNRSTYDEEADLTHYVCTRHYRAPELILGNHTGYGYGVDVWALGCSVAEMVLRSPLFPGSDYTHQLSLILHALGTNDIPSDVYSPEGQDFVNSYVQHSTTVGSDEPRKRSTTSSPSLAPPSRCSWEVLQPDIKSRFYSQKFYDATEDEPITEEVMALEYEYFIDFLNATLQYDPAKRASASDLTQCKWLQDFDYECAPVEDASAGKTVDWQSDKVSEANSPQRLIPLFIQQFEIFHAKKARCN